MMHPENNICESVAIIIPAILFDSFSIVINPVLGKMVFNFNPDGMK
jgi:hypothetical protein